MSGNCGRSNHEPVSIVRTDPFLLVRMLFVCVGLDWARPCSSSTLIALIKLLLRLRSHARIGVRAVGKQNQRANKEEEALHGKPSTSVNKAYELTTTYTTFARYT
jgi:hypothetical protein